MRLTCTPNGEWHATFKHRSGTLCFGYGKTWSEAANFCLELIQQQDNK